jgi:hypothetical protein
MILGLKRKTTHNLYEIIGLPGSGKSVVAQACAIRTGSEYFNLPELQLSEPVDRCLLSSLNNIKLLVNNPEQWGDIYYMYLRRIESEIAQALEVGDVWVTNYVNTLNLYQRALNSPNKYTLKTKAIKVYTDVPIIKKYNYKNIDFYTGHSYYVQDLKSNLKTQISFVPKKYLYSVNYRSNPEVYLNELSKNICSAFKLTTLPYTIKDGIFSKKKEEPEA